MRFSSWKIGKYIKALGSIFMVVSHTLEIAIYVLKSANGCTCLYMLVNKYQNISIWEQKSLISWIRFCLGICTYCKLEFVNKICVFNLTKSVFHAWLNPIYVNTFWPVDLIIILKCQVKFAVWGWDFVKKMLSNYFPGLQMVGLIFSVAQNCEVVILDWLLSYKIAETTDV